VKPNVQHEAFPGESRVNESGTDSTGRARGGTLFVVATPIGNLQDLSPRATACLRDADLLLAEDTRHTRKLLVAAGIERDAAHLQSLHEHNERERTPAIVQRLRDGATVALVTDAGTPLLSDPGAWLVAEAVRANVAVVTVPGPCAAIAALSIAGLSTARFVFEGFLPAKSAARKAALEVLARESRTLVFYEAPHRLRATLIDLREALGGERPASVARELTKLYECVYRGTLGTLVERSAIDPDMSRGELVIVVAGATAEGASDVDAERERESARVLALLLGDGLSVSQAARLAAQITGRSRKELYERALAHASRGENEGS
jgi:16S rRNA (cytidine1402-2'-O)-methyltransferase